MANSRWGCRSRPCQQHVPSALDDMVLILKVYNDLYDRAINKISNNPLIYCPLPKTAKTRGLPRPRLIALWLWWPMAVVAHGPWP